jgi:coenzyme F420-reducing hydrogenase delta subunit
MTERESDSLQILAYCCHYCAYAAADLAGVLRIRYPAATKILELPCTGRLDLLEVLHAFEGGADGVMVAGCLKGDCHFQEGNFNARRRVERIKGLLKAIGIDSDRIRMFNMSSAMAKQFAQAAEEMAEQITSLGPSPLREEMDVARRANILGGRGH